MMLRKRVLCMHCCRLLPKLKATAFAPENYMLLLWQYDTKVLSTLNVKLVQ